VLFVYLESKLRNEPFSDDYIDQHIVVSLHG
jgi:hypothetical protein